MKYYITIGTGIYIEKEIPGLTRNDIYLSYSSLIVDSSVHEI